MNEKHASSAPGMLLTFCDACSLYEVLDLPMRTALNAPLS